MLNLLTDAQRHKVLKEYRMRLAIVICGAVVFVCLSGTVLLLPNYLTAMNKVNSVKTNNDYKKQTISSLNAQNLKGTIKLVDSNLQALKISINIISPREVYEKIQASIPEGVLIDRYTYNLIDDNTASISLSGTSVDRNKLIDFQNKLKLNPEFTGIGVPLDSFSKKSNLSFSINFNLIKVIKK